MKAQNRPAHRATPFSRHGEAISLWALWREGFEDFVFSAQEALVPLHGAQLIAACHHRPLSGRKK